MLQDISIFLCVADTQSFRAAADRLGMTPAGVSKAIQRVERDVGARLFNRTTRRVRLTQAGTIFRDKATAAKALVEDGRQAVALLRDAAEGLVRVSAPPVLSALLTPVLAALLDRYPGLRLHLGLTDRPADLQNGEADIAIRIGDTAAPDLRRRRITTLRWSTVAAPAYLDRRGYPAALEDLDAHTCLAFIAPSGHQVPWRFGADERPVSSAMTFDLGTGLVDAACAGAGIAQVFEHMVGDAIRAGRLVTLFPDQAAGGPDVYALTTAEAGQLARVRLVLDGLYAAWR